jgi:hypothetical protein
MPIKAGVNGDGLALVQPLKQAAASREVQMG